MKTTVATFEPRFRFVRKTLSELKKSEKVYYRTRTVGSWFVLTNADGTGAGVVRNNEDCSPLWPARFGITSLDNAPKGVGPALLLSFEGAPNSFGPGLQPEQRNFLEERAKTVK